MLQPKFILIQRHNHVFQGTPNPSLIERKSCKRALTSSGHADYHSCEALRMGSPHHTGGEIRWYHSSMLGLQSYD